MLLNYVCRLPDCQYYFVSSDLLLFSGVLYGKEICVTNTWFNREEKRKVTFRMGENGIEIDFLQLIFFLNIDGLYKM